MSSVTIPTVEYAALVKTADAYRTLVNDLWPVVIIFLILTFAEAIAFVYWWWRCRTSEEELACRKGGDANTILQKAKLQKQEKRMSVPRRSRAHGKPGRKK
ncbi:MAG: hypothetical protein WC455_09385 [Dehalococcoidia bacterium]|jgi:hypothetical protein